MFNGGIFQHLLNLFAPTGAVSIRSTCSCPSHSITPVSPQACSHCGNSGKMTSQKLTSPDTSLIVDPSSEQCPEDNSNLYLQKPQLAVWDGKNTHVVELNKEGHPSFGFKFKVKAVKNEDTYDIYTLVESVTKTGPAKNQLHVGDWIRSVNGTPIQTYADAFDLISDKPSLLRLVVQRPIGFSQKPIGVHGDKPDKYVTDTLPHSPSPQSARDLEHMSGGSAPIPGIIEPPKAPDKPVQTMNIYISQEAPSLSNNESEIQHLPFPKTVKLPKVRIFICGSEAEKCANYILKESEIELMCQGPGYSYSFCSMTTDCSDNVVTSPPCANMYAASSQSSPFSSYMPSASSCSQKGVGDLRCKACGSDSPSAQNALGTVVNIELFVISDDSFFHSCCHYLFTKSSIFILTFNGGKLLRSSACEFSHLQNLSHTIRSFAGDECVIMSCGLLDSGTEARNMVDEVRALFYTPFNTQLQTFNVSGPELVNLKASTLACDGISASKQLQTLLWKVVIETIQRQRVLQPSLLLSDHFYSQRNGEIFIKETQLTSIMRHKLPQYGDDVYQDILTYLIMNREIILGKATPYNNSKIHKIESHVILEPKILLDVLFKIISTINEDKLAWSRTIATGFIPAGALTKLCGHSESKSILDFLESFGLILRRPETETSDKILEYFLPYFCVMTSASKELVPAEKKDSVLYLQFNECTSTLTFLQLMFYLASQSDTPANLSVLIGYCCSFQHEGLLIIAKQEKVEDRVKFIIRREDKNICMKNHEMYAWLYSACHVMLEHFVLGAQCPLGDQCPRSSPTRLHIVDLHETRPQYCCQVRIDNQKPIAMWRQKDFEPQTSSNAKIVNNEPKKVTELPYSVIWNICSMLAEPNVLGRNWKGLAGEMGYTDEQVKRYDEHSSDPVQKIRDFLCDWSRSPKNTLQKLIIHLTNMERLDVIYEIDKALGKEPFTEKAEPVLYNIPVNSAQAKGQGHSEMNNLELVDMENKGQHEVTSTPVNVITKANPLSDV